MSDELRFICVMILVAVILSAFSFSRLMIQKNIQQIGKTIDTQYYVESDSFITETTAVLDTEALNVS